jgi:UDP-N-acetylmuramyl pentapeptide phosphotransferase/UDP-N-acetylglucosamine-1-phosphate transferase
VVWALLLAAMKSGLAWRIAVDEPNERSLHVQATPRIGGLALVGTVLVLIGFAAPAHRVIAAIAGCLLLVSAADDRIGLAVPLRLAAHFTAAIGAAFVLGPVAPWWLVVLVVVVLVWSMNLYNFMDGADGLAGGMTAAGFGAYALAAVLAGANELALVSAAIAGGASGFLVHNFPPARVFLGDAGSVPLGFLAAALGVAGCVGGAWPVGFPLLVFSPFIVDATLTLLIRALRGDRVWTPHRQHLYQRMVRSGLGHRRTALLWYCAMAVSAAAAFASISWPFGWQIGLLFAWCAIYASVAAALQRVSNSVQE